MSPDVVANVFAGRDLLGRFAGLCAYRIENGAVTPIAQRWWQTGPCQKLAALSATLQAEESANETETEDEYKLRHARELAKWRDKSPGLLPAGAFVFKDEFQLIYSNEFEYGHYHFMGDDRKPLSALQHSERMALDYSPFVDSQTSTLIMAGFESYAPTVGAPVEELPLSQKQKTATPAPLTTNQIAACFAEFHGWDFEKWKTNLQSPSPWLKNCQGYSGEQGGRESTWFPLLIAEALDKKHPKKIRHTLHARFKNQEPLKPWFEQLEINLPLPCEI